MRPTELPERLHCILRPDFHDPAGPGRQLLHNPGVLWDDTLVDLQ